MDPTKSLSESDDSTGFAALTQHASTAIPRELPPPCLGDYELGPEIGRGGMGVVYLATEKGLCRKVALKVLPTNARVSSVHIKRFLIEARAAAQLNHDNIVPIYHIGVDAGTHFFAMKLIDGEDLGQVILRAKESLEAATKHDQDSLPATMHAGSTLDLKRERPNEHTQIDFSGASFNSSMQLNGFRSAQRLATSVAIIGQQVANALQHAHENGIIHRDIKPSNLMLDSNHKVWVTDFGLAQLQNGPGLTHTGDVVGTLRYMSPEQASGRRAFVDHRTDIYSLGIALYELVTLQHACRAQTPREILREVTFERPVPIRKINPRLPRDFETIICKATERNPTDRYQSAADMADDLRRFANGESLVARRPSRVKRVRDWLYEHPLFTSGIAASLMMVVTSLSIATAALQSNLMLAKEKQVETVARLSESEGQRLQTLSMIKRDENPGLSVALALQGAREAPGFAADQALMSAISGNHELSMLTVPMEAPGSLALSPGGERLVIACNRELFARPTPALLYDMRTRTQVATLDETACTTVAFGDNGRLLATGGAAPTRDAQGQAKTFEELQFSPVNLHTAVTGQKLKTFSDAHVQKLTGAEFTPDGKFLVLPSRGNSAHVYGTSDWSTALVLPHAAPVIQAIYSPDGLKIATWTTAGLAFLWDAATGDQLHEIAYEASSPFDASIVFSPDSRHIMFRGDAGISIHSIDEPAHRIYRREEQAEFGRSSDLVYIRSLDGERVYVFSLATEQVIAECRTPARIDRFIVSSDDKYVLAVCGHEVHIFDARNGSWITECQGHTDLIVDVISHSTPEIFTSISWDGSLRDWSVRSDAEARTYSADILPNGPPIVDYSSDGKHALFASVAGFTTTIYQAGQAANDYRELTQVSGELLEVLAEDSLLTAEDGLVSVWNASNSRLLARLALPRQRIIEAFSGPGPAEALLLTEAGQVLSWKTQEMQTTQLTGLGEVAATVAVNPQTSAVLIGLLDGSFLSIDREHQRTVLAEFPASVIHIDVNRLGSQAVVVTSDDQAHLWDLLDNTENSLIAHAEFPIREALFAGSDELVVTHAFFESSQIGLWNINDGELIASLQIPGIRDVALGDGREQLAIASSRQGTVLWDLTSHAQTLISEQPSRCVCVANNQVVIATERRRSLIGPGDPPQTKSLPPSQLLIWDGARQEIVAQSDLRFNAARIRSLAEEGRFGVSGKSFGAEVSEVENGRVMAKLLEHGDVLAFAAFAPTDADILTVSSDGQILLHNLQNGDTVALGGPAYQLTAVPLSPDRKLLITSDSHRQTLQWDLQSRTHTERTPSDELVTKHVIGGSGNMAASITASNAIEVWDLRSGQGQRYEFDLPVQDVVLAPNEKYLLAISATHRISTSSSRAFTLRGVYATGDAYLVNLATRKKEPIFPDSSIVCGKFVDSGRSLAVLDEAHRIHVLDLETQAELLIETSPPCLSLLESPLDSPHVYGSALNRFVGWDTRTGQQTLDVPVQLAEGDADGDLLNWQIQPPNSDWWVFYQNRAAFRFPREPVDYVSKKAPRELSAKEKSQYLLPFEQPRRD